VTAVVVGGGGGAEVVVGGGGGAEVVVGGGREIMLVEITTGGTLVVLARVVGAGMDVTLEAGGAGRPGIPRQAPKSDLQPAPQKSREEPHQKN
jgi:hypothetical protein